MEEIITSNDTDCFVIKKELLNRIATFDFKDMISEVEYTIKLARENVKVAFVEDLRVYTSIDKFEFRIPSLSKRVEIFRNEIMNSQTILSREF